MKRVLVVDDDRSLLSGLVRFLAEAGLDPTGAASFDEAEALLRREPFDVLVTDLDLPGGTGLELVDRARRFRPGLAAILVTGYGCSAVRRQAGDRGLLGYFEKPFDPAALLALMRSV